MEKETVPNQYVEFVVMRTAQLPNNQGVQVNYTTLINDGPEVLMSRAKRAEDHILKIRSLHIVEVLEEKQQQFKVLVSSEMDTLDSLQKEAKKGLRMTENRKTALANIPAQLEKHRLELEILVKELDRQRDIAKDLA
jgi:hypothetical protein